MTPFVLRDATSLLSNDREFPGPGAVRSSAGVHIRFVN